MMTSEGIDWTAEQICGECGVGAFQQASNGDALCEECGHEHPMDPVNLGDNEVFIWTTAPDRMVETLHVVAHRLI